MKCEVITPPATLPLDYASEAKPHLRLFDDTQQAYVQICMEDATDFFQTETDCSLVTQTLMATYYDSDAGFHHLHGYYAWGYGLNQYHHQRRRLPLPNGPVTSIVQVSANGVVVDPSQYDLRAAGNTDYLYLTSIATVMPPIEITYQAGFATGLDEYGDYTQGLPKDIRRALLYMVSNFFEQREPTTNKANNIQNFGLERIFSKYRRTSM